MAKKGYAIRKFLTVRDGQECILKFPCNNKEFESAIKMYFWGRYRVGPVFLKKMGEKVDERMIDDYKSIMSIIHDFRKYPFYAGRPRKNEKELLLTSGYRFKAWVVSRYGKDAIMIAIEK